MLLLLLLTLSFAHAQHPDERDLDCIIRMIAMSGVPGGEDTIADIRMAQKLALLTDKNQGATFNLFADKELTGKPYSAIAIYPERTKIVKKRALLRNDIQWFYYENRELLRNANHSIGVWHNKEEGSYELDIVVTVPNDIRGGHELSREIARQYNQKAYFDLGAGQVIKLTGTDGTTPPNLPPVEARYDAIRRRLDEALRN
jgi:hypothetical protein